MILLENRMGFLRKGLLKGALRHIAIVPRLVISVRGWPCLLADCLGRRRQPYLLALKGGPTCEIRSGSSDWWIFLEIFVFGIYRRAQDDIRHAGVVIDVGANVGFFALYVSSINPGVKIHAFEPFPKNAEQLNKNLQINPGGQVVLHQAAVADQTRDMELYFAPGDDSGCTLNEIRSRSCPVKAIGVNELFAACGIAKCDLLKMDCEGSELSILQAASPSMLMAIQAVIMEYHVPAEVATILGILSGAGFKCEVIQSIKTIYASRS
jgi:FkbM family methyltransferase